MLSAKRRIISRSGSRPEAKKPSRNNSRTVSRKKPSRTASRKKPAPKKEKIQSRRYLITKKRAEEAEKFAKKMGNLYVSSKTRLSRPRSRNASRNLRTANRNSRANSRTNSRPNKKEEKKKKSAPKTEYKVYSGTIIYDSKNPLNPFKWNPEDSSNHPSYHKWDTLLPGTHILDKNTCLTWIVEKNHKISLAPCQTVRVELEVPEDLDNFNPALCLNPFLPEINKIPDGTRFFFKDSSQCYQLSSDKSLEPVNHGNLRPPQVIPIPINSLYNTQQLVGLNTPVRESSLQQPSNGYHTIDQWLDGLILGNDILPGYLGELPLFSKLQDNDVLEFYDPNLRSNPRIKGLNPDGTPYIEDLHESKYFSFRLQIISDEDGKLSGRQITAPRTSFLCNINVPIETTNQGRMIYIRSVILVPHQGDPLIVLNELENPYFLDKNPDELINNINNGLNKLGYPYSQIKATFFGRSQENYIINLTHLPSHLYGVVMSSDTYPPNKYEGSGRFFLGFSSNSQGSIYSFESDLNMEHLSVHAVNIDGVNLELDNMVNLNSNQEVSFLINSINKKLPELGYPGYTMNIFWSEGNEKTDDTLIFYLAGAIQYQLPAIVMNINGEELLLDFSV